tara:strand:+ start:1130 stop:1546 length:417 start_codon:yes stop_codon:yes gene_type:complete
MKLLNKNYFLYFIFFILIIKLFNTPYATYNIVKFNYKERMTATYGFCNKESWGYYNYIKNNFNLKDKEVRIINKGGFVRIDPLFPELNASSNNNSQYLVVLNFETTDRETIFNSDIKNINKYYIKNRFGNCYLLELND